MSQCSNSHAQPRGWAGIYLTLAALLAPVSAYEADPRYVFISSPTKKNIYYSALPLLEHLSKHTDDRPAPNASILINGTVVNTCKEGDTLCTPPSGKLESPAGLAVWHGKEKAVLYVADSVLHKIFAYQITAGTVDLNSIVAGPQQVVAQGLSGVSGLALDGYGNLYYVTIEGAVGMLPANKLEPLNKPAPVVLYSADAQKALSSPIGLAADNFNVYWTNQANGQQVGAVVKAFERDAATLAAKYPDYPKAVAKNTAKSMGVCVARNNVFFTGEAQFLYGVKVTGGSITEVHSGFQEPRGCAYDGENTVYVADQKAGAVYSLPSNMPTIRAVQKVQKVAVVEAPSSVAVFTRAPAYVLQPAGDNGFLGLGW